MFIPDCRWESLGITFDSQQSGYKVSNFWISSGTEQESAERVAKNHNGFLRLKYSWDIFSIYEFWEYFKHNWDSPF